MADTLNDFYVDTIYSNPATRAHQTIAPFAKQIGLQILTEPDLREQKLGEESFEDFFGAVEACACYLLIRLFLKSPERNCVDRTR